MAILAAGSAVRVTRYAKDTQVKMDSYLRSWLPGTQYAVRSEIINLRWKPISETGHAVRGTRKIINSRWKAILEAVHKNCVLSTELII